MIVLELRELCVTLRGHVLLCGVNLAARKGELIALLGQNGAGKTTLLRAALGLLSHTGEVRLDGKPVRALRDAERAGIAAWLPQQSSLAEPVSALELVASARYRFSEPRAAAERAAMAALAQTGVEAFARRPMTQLSGGEQQRVAMAALLAQEAPLLLLDEPGNHLDPAQQIELYALIGRLWRAGKTVLCITHDVNMLRYVGERAGEIRVLGLSGGRLCFETTYGSETLAARLGELFGLQLRVLENEGERLLVPARIEP